MFYERQYWTISPSLSLSLCGSGRQYNGRVSRSANLACLSKIYGSLIVKKSSNMYGKISDMYFLNSLCPIHPSIHTFTRHMQRENQDQANHAGKHAIQMDFRVLFCRWAQQVVPPVWVLHLAAVELINY